MIFKTGLKLFNLNLIKQPLLLWVLSVSFSSFIAHAKTENVKSKVSRDIALFKSFDVQSEILRQSSQGGFMTIGADAACDFDSAVNS